MSDLEPLPLDDVMAIVDRRARRQRVVLRSALGVGAVAAVVVGAQAVSRESEPGSEETPTASDDGATTSMPTTETTLPGDGERPEWQTEAAVHALDELGFQFTDAEAIAAQWGVGTSDAKLLIGVRVLAGEPIDDP